MAGIQPNLLGGFVDLAPRSDCTAQWHWQVSACSLALLPQIFQPILSARELDHTLVDFLFNWIVSKHGRRRMRGTVTLRFSFNWFYLKGTFCSRRSAYRAGWFGILHGSCTINTVPVFLLTILFTFEGGRGRPY